MQPSQSSHIRSVQQVRTKRIQRKRHPITAREQEVYFVEDVMRILSIGQSLDYRMIKYCNRELAAARYFTIAGHVPIAKFREKMYNVLIPVTSMTVMSNMQRIIVNEVRLDTTVDQNGSGRDIYKERSTRKFAITKVGGMKLAAAANISIVSSESVQPDVCMKCIEMTKATGKAQPCGACPHSYDVKYIVTVRVPEPSGGFHLVRKDKEIDCTMEKSSMTDNQYKRFLPHRASIAESKALMRYKATVEQDKALNKAKLQKEILSLGAFHVAESIAEDIDDGVNAYETESVDTPTAALRRYFDMAGTNPAPAARLEELAVPLIRKADDAREADQHTGAFIPRRIVVKNYRSYTTAAFDFADIHMAMVNGQNGVGKSSLFMDAIADCLFEHSRDGQLGGWLREGERSSAVTFEFDMGGTEYRVARTRTKSGKGTLAFNRLNENGDWIDCGDSTMKLTQAKIENTLGMDAQTFCSIALIRQDAYGLFLEADSDRRMEVLSALLNLGIYVRLEGFAKDALEADDLHWADVQAETQQSIQMIDERISTAQREEALRQEVAARADEKDKEADTLTIQVSDKSTALSKAEAERDEALTLADMTPAAEKANSIIAEARRLLEILSPAEADLRNLNEKRTVLRGTITTIDNRLRAIIQARQTHLATLTQRDEIEAAVKRIGELTDIRAELEKRAAQYAEAWQAWNTLETARKTFLAESQTRIGALNSKVEIAKGKAALLQDSKCPIPNEATCAFLRNAQEAQATLNAIQNPRVEAEAITQEEYRLRPIAALAPKLEAAAATLAELDKQEEQLTTTRKETEDALQEIVAKIPDLELKATQATERQNNAIAERGVIKTRLEAIADAQKQHDAYADEVKKTAQTLNDYQTLAQAFGIDGIQYMIIRTIVPEIMHQANDILAAMTADGWRLTSRPSVSKRATPKLSTVSTFGFKALRVEAAHTAVTVEGKR